MTLNRKQVSNINLSDIDLKIIYRILLIIFFTALIANFTQSFTSNNIDFNFVDSLIQLTSHSFFNPAGSRLIRSII